MMDLAKLQESAGHEVGFFAMDHPENEDSEYEFLFPSHVELNPPPQGVAERLRVAGRVIYSQESREKIEKVLDLFQPDVVHLHNIYHQLSPSILTPIAEKGVPAVMTLHDYKLACPTYQFLDHGEICEACIGGRFRNAVMRRCNDSSISKSALSALELRIHRSVGSYEPIDILVCPSKFMMDKMSQANVFPERLVHLNHFVDVSGIAAADRPGAGVIFAGRLSSEKGVDTLINALAELGGGVELSVVGEGPERGVLEGLSASAAPGRVKFHGRVAATELHEMIRRASVVVVPSRWYENQPMVILEAFACARPVIGSELGGIPELIVENATGTIVPPNDPQALAEAIQPYVDDSSRAHAMGLAARQGAVADFSSAAHLSELERIYARAGESTVVRS